MGTVQRICLAWERLKSSLELKEDDQDKLGTAEQAYTRT